MGREDSRLNSKNDCLIRYWNKNESIACIIGPDLTRKDRTACFSGYCVLNA